MSKGMLTIGQLVDLIGSPAAVPLIAEVDDGIAGMALGVCSAGVGWFYEVVVDPDAAKDEDVLPRLLEHLEWHLAERGARRLVVVTIDEERIARALESRGFRPNPEVRYHERRVPSTVATPTALAELGGRMIPPGLWGELKGMEEPKRIIERRVILPLAEPELAARHGVSPPKAIVQFGPPGTGKTTFAKGIASRLEWPFVEVHPSELAGGSPDERAAALAETVDQVLDLPSAVVFVDEVEALASVRTDDRRVSRSVTNEFLKQIPRFRQVPRHLLVCATNGVGRLDPAFLRPGRFDYILPVGPPDAEARDALWRRYVEEITDDPVDVGALVDATDLFTPADIEFAARKAAQRAFEREHFEEVSQRAGTEDFLDAIRETRPTLTEEMVEAFLDDTDRFARY